MASFSRHPSAVKDADWLCSADRRVRRPQHPSHAGVVGYIFLVLYIESTCVCCAVLRAILARRLHRKLTRASLNVYLVCSIGACATAREVGSRLLQEKEPSQQDINGLREFVALIGRYCNPVSASQKFGPSSSGSLDVLDFIHEHPALLHRHVADYLFLCMLSHLLMHDRCDDFFHECWKFLYLACKSFVLPMVAYHGCTATDTEHLQ